MHYFTYINDELYCEDVPIRKICEEFGTPAFVYSKATLQRHFEVFKSSFESIDHLVCFSVKACSNLAVIRLFSDMGSGMDIVSGGELFRSLKAGVDPAKIVYSGVGKRIPEIDEALAAGILMFNVESEEETFGARPESPRHGKESPCGYQNKPGCGPENPSKYYDRP